MSDNDKLLARLAQMETELSALRSQSRQPAQDPNAWVKALITDPVGTMTKYGIPVDHITRAGVAHVMGDQAPPQFQMAAPMGPVYSATRDLATSVEAISRRLDAQDRQAKVFTTRESLKTLAADSKKYPHLAKAYAANPALFESDVSSHQGSAEDLAGALEARQAAIASVYGVKLDAPPASVNAENNDQTPSAQGQSANAGVTSGDVPQLPQSKAGVFDPKADHEKLKEEILRKHNLL